MFEDEDDYLGAMFGGADDCALCGEPAVAVCPLCGAPLCLDCFADTICTCLVD